MLWLTYKDKSQGWGWLADSERTISGGRKEGSPNETSVGDHQHKGELLGWERQGQKDNSKR